MQRLEKLGMATTISIKGYWCKWTWHTITFS